KCDVNARRSRSANTARSVSRSSAAELVVLQSRAQARTHEHRHERLRSSARRRIDNSIVLSILSLDTPLQWVSAPLPYIQLLGRQPATARICRENALSA